MTRPLERLVERLIAATEESLTELVEIRSTNEATHVVLCRIRDSLLRAEERDKHPMHYSDVLKEEVVDGLTWDGIDPPGPRDQDDHEHQVLSTHLRGGPWWEEDDRDCL